MVVHVGGRGPGHISRRWGSSVSAAALSLNFLTGALDARITFTRASLATLVDSTGKITYAPNNLVANGTTGTWVGGTATTGVADKDGGTSAVTLTSTAAAQQVYYAVGSLSAGNYIVAVWARRRTGTGTVSLYNPQGTITTAMTALDGTWRQFYVLQSAPATSLYVDFLFAASGDAIDVYIPAMSQVTYETTPRAGDNKLTTGSAYYGPRFDYNPSTLAALGLLIEEQRTNSCLQSQAFTAAAWSAQGSVSTDNFIASPDGTTNAAKFAEDLSVTTNHSIFQGLTATTNAVNTIYAKQGTGRYITLSCVDTGPNGCFAVFDLQAGTVTQQTGLGTGTVKIATITPAGNGWYRLTVAANGTSTAVYLMVSLGNTGTPAAATDSYGRQVYTGTGLYNYVWGAQQEVGSFATSYIPTTTAAVTRSADVASMTGTNFSSWFNASAGTFVFDVDLLGSSGAQPITEIDDGTTNNRFFLYTSALSSILRVDTGAVNQIAVTYGTVVAGTPYKSAFAYQVNDIAVSQSGGAIQSVGVATIPAVTTMRLGVDLSGNGSSRHFRAITFYNTRQSNAQLQVLST